MEIQSNICLSKYSTYRTGGPADFLGECKSKKELLSAIDYAKDRKLDFRVIGGGNNILFSDAGFRGLVIVNKIGGIEINGTRITVGSGYPISKLTLELSNKGLSGLEFMIGIPGTIGGAISGNAGAWGHEISEKLEKIAVIDKNNNLKEIYSKDIIFSYRKSDLAKKGYIVISATFKLEKREPNEIKKEMKDYLEKKRDSQPKGFSCGSYFKNPKEKPAGMIIEDLGFKGKRIGGAQVSEKHANFILNTGNAVSKDIYQLAQMIKKAAKEKLGIELKEEVKYIGKFND